MGASKDPEVLTLREHCGGAELHWRDRPSGESLQGWYRSKTKARAAAKVVEGAVLVIDGRLVGT